MKLLKSILNWIKNLFKPRLGDHYLDYHEFERLRKDYLERYRHYYPFYHY